MAKLFKNPLFYLGIFAGALIIFEAINLVMAFNNPPGNPPTGGGAIGVGTNAPANSLYVSSSGNIGVGLTNPTFKLDVNGSLRASGNWSLGGPASTSLNMAGRDIDAVNKLTVTIIDPVYEIAGKKYATYVSDTIGLKTVYYGKGKLARNSGSAAYSYAIDFNGSAEGSDLWLFWQTIDEGENMDGIVVILSAEGEKADLWYELRPDDKTIVIYGDRAASFSYQLAAPRHDARNWPTEFIDSSDWGASLEPK